MVCRSSTSILTSILRGKGEEPSERLGPPSGGPAQEAERRNVVDRMRRWLQDTGASFGMRESGRILRREQPLFLLSRMRPMEERCPKPKKSRGGFPFPGAALRGSKGDGKRRKSLETGARRPCAFDRASNAGRLHLYPTPGSPAPPYFRRFPPPRRAGIQTPHRPSGRRHPCFAPVPKSPESARSPAWSRRDRGRLFGSA